MQPLAGVTVADLTRYLPGPFASRELLRLGARVVKIEPPEGDPVAHSNPAAYRALNDGKEILTWDARSEPTPDALRRGGRRARGLPSRRLGAPRRRRSPETAILCSITGFGAAGPHAQDAGHDLNYLGYAGALHDTAPGLPPIQVADLGAGAQSAVIEILAALIERERTGLGAHIVVSMTHGSHRFVAHRLHGEPVPRLLTGGAACYRIYETADGAPPHRRGARAEVLAQPLRPARPPRLHRARIRRTTCRSSRRSSARARRVNGSTCSKARTPASAPC